MSGHSKWSNIKREKGIKDKQRSSIFSKLARIITLAVIEGGGITDPENNIKLRLAIEKAKAENFPKENIERAIEKGTGSNSQQLKEVIYEGFGPGGISLIVQATTDNMNRTLSEVRNTLELHNGKLGNQGAVLHLFEKCGLATFKTDEAEEKSVFEFADEIKAFDFDKDDNFFYVYFPYELIGKVRGHLANLKTSSIDVDYKPRLDISIKDDKTVETILELAEALENLDDVHKVFINGKIN